MFEKAKAARGTVARYVRYGYFLRIPLLGYVVLPLLCVLDGLGKTSAITRGIMTVDLNAGWQVFHTTFFTVALLMAVLVCARNIVINGLARFDAQSPDWLCYVLSDTTPRTMWRVLTFFQFPALVTLGYVGWITHNEAWPSWTARDLGGYLAWTFAGLAAAAVFWYLVSLFYLWTYPNEATRPPSALVFPGMLPMFQAAKDARKPKVADWLETAAGFALKWSHAGYADEAKEPIWELHFLAAVALAAFLLLYFFLYPLIAPVLVTSGLRLDVLIAVVLWIAFLVGAFDSNKELKAGESGASISTTGILFSVLMTGLVLTFFYFYVRDQIAHYVLLDRAFPTLGAVLVILIFFQWLFSGLSFFLDRYRLPVVITAVLIVLLWNVLPWVHTDEDHYFTAAVTGPLTPANVDSPYQVIQRRQAAADYSPDDPYVIVTASGGGIQAAEWTAQVMAKLETTFAATLPGYKLHDHVLLVSSVSGGSVGMMPYLLEYTATLGPGQNVFMNTPDDRLTRRLTRAPGCSSLEAVGWGLEYYDMQKLLVPLRFSWHQAFEDGDAPDRTWALGEAFNRNLVDDGCQTGAKEFAGLPAVMDGKSFTLRQAVDWEQTGRMPAFAFNTTVAETGGRFLLSNYQVPEMPPRTPFASAGAASSDGHALTVLGSDFLPAESFLQAYTEQGKGPYADLPLVIAARLGATFPLVSSATRIPTKFVKGTASHFLDGGYFDNDGTATATEFLLSAMEQSRSYAADKSAGKDRAPLKPLRILLVEIRDGSDLDPGVNLDDLDHQTGALSEPDSPRPKPWGVVDQLMSPLLGLWNAGHVSVTRRTRRELCAVETAYTASLEIHHVVFAIPDQLKNPSPTSGSAAQGQSPEYKSSPLSWKLTPAQQHYIKERLNSETTKAEIQDALHWVAADHKAPLSTAVPACQVLDEMPLQQR